jgi:hypothetical protein
MKLVMFPAWLTVWELRHCSKKFVCVYLYMLSSLSAYLQRGPPIAENKSTTHRTHRTHRTQRKNKIHQRRCAEVLLRSKLSSCCWNKSMFRDRDRDRDSFSQDSLIEYKGETWQWHRCTESILEQKQKQNRSCHRTRAHRKEQQHAGTAGDRNHCLF